MELDPHLIYGSGSRRETFETKNRTKIKEIGGNYIFFNEFGTAPRLLTFEQSFLSFQLQKNLHTVPVIYFKKILKLDLDPH